MIHLRAFLALPAADKLLRVEALCWLWLIRIMLWLFPYGIWSGLTRKLKTPFPAAELADETIDRLAYSVRRMHVFVPRATCLTQALVLQMLLARRGQLSELKVGVAPHNSGKIEAHAWVVVRGRVIIGNNHRLSRYALFPAGDHF
ncbi:MAG: lasso peptide biosynthesis B2 protein [Anaerolinea sp.]|nr:lasso peptide biosynthesis B2 protein [Anaerolinea sp.]